MIEIKPIVLQCNCKINTNLQITGIRDDGYHELKSIFYPLPKPFDLMHINKGISEGLSLKFTDNNIDPCNNTIKKAYEGYAKHTGFSPSLNIFMEKNIPIGAGLGGGSSNAAQILLYLNNINKNTISQEELKNIAIKIGADVPFFLQNKPCLIKGIGDILTELPFFLHKHFLVLLCPATHISTIWAYEEWDKFNLQKNYSSDLTSLPVEAKKTGSYCTYVKNTFEDMVFHQYPELRVFKEIFIQFGAKATALSGSGSSIFGVFTKESKAQKVYDFFINQKERAYL